MMKLVNSALLLVALGCGSESGMVAPTRGAEANRPSLTVRYSDWSEPVNLGSGVNSGSPDQGVFVSRDELTLYFVSQRPAPEGFGANDIYVSTRESRDAPWGRGVNLGPRVNTAGTESTPALSSNEKELFVATNGRGGTTGLDIWVWSRHDHRSPLDWQAPERLEGGVNSVANDLGAAPFYDRGTRTLTLYFYSVRSGGAGCRDLYRSTQGEDGVFSPAVRLTELNTSSEDEQPAIRRDGLEMFFISNYPDKPCLGPGTPGGDIYVSTRGSTSEPWGTPVNLGAPINTLRAEGRPALSFDGKSLYFFSDGHGGEGGTDLFVSTRTELDDDDGVPE
jgi:hypothetical protein